MEEKKYVDLTIYLDEDVAQRLKRLCEKTEQREEEVIRWALEEMVKEGALSVGRED